MIGRTIVAHINNTYDYQHALEEGDWEYMITLTDETESILPYGGYLNENCPCSYRISWAKIKYARNILRCPWRYTNDTSFWRELLVSAIDI
jgi:hypothetical protein